MSRFLDQISAAQLAEWFALLAVRNDEDEQVALAARARAGLTTAPRRRRR